MSLTRRTAILAWPNQASMSDGEVAAAMNAETVTVDGDSPILAISNALWYFGRADRTAATKTGGPWGRMVDDSVHHADADRRKFLLDCLYLFEAKGADTIGWGDNANYPVSIEECLDGLISYGYIDANLKAYVMGQRYRTIPKWSPPISEIECAFARRGTEAESQVYG